MKRWQRWAREGAVLVAVVVAISLWQARNLLGSGDPAPQVGALDVSAFKGKRALVYFYAPWCGVCKMNGGQLSWVRKIFGDEAVAIVPVALSYETPESALAFAKDHEYPAAPVLAGDDVGTAWRIEAFPTYYVLRADGTVAGATVGYATLPGLVTRLILAGL